MREQHNLMQLEAEQQQTKHEPADIKTLVLCAMK